MHLTVGIFGPSGQELAKQLAKSGTINDIAIYNHASSEGVFTYICPNSEKIHPLLQAIGMADFPVIVISSMSKELAEQIVALDAAHFEYGFIIADGVPEEQIRQIIKGTSLESFQILPNDPVELRQQIAKVPIKRDENAGPWLPIDNYFNVKGVGTVALSVVKHGKVKKYDNLRLEPLGKEVMIKGMQSQDRDIVEAEAGMRLGVNVKGAEAEDMKRGYVICKAAKVVKEAAVTFVKSKYCKEEIVKDVQIFIAVGLQVIAATVADVAPGKLNLKLEQPLVYQPGQHCIFASTKQTLPRIIGSGIVE